MFGLPDGFANCVSPSCDCMYYYNLPMRILGKHHTQQQQVVCTSYQIYCTKYIKSTTRRLTTKFSKWSEPILPIFSSHHHVCLSFIGGQISDGQGSKETLNHKITVEVTPSLAKVVASATVLQDISLNGQVVRKTPSYSLLFIFLTPNHWGLPS